MELPEDGSLQVGSAEAVTEEVEAWRQGDVANLRRFAHIADLARPLTTASIQAAEQSKGRKIITTEIEGIVLITQTCDIVRDPSERPFVEACPLVTVSQEKAAAALYGEIIYYAAVPWHTDLSVADLDRVMTLEKSVLANLRRLARCSTDEQLIRFQNSLSRRYGRFAFPDDFTAGMKRFRDKVRSRHGRPNSPEGRLFARILEVRVSATPGWESPSFAVEFTFIIPSDLLPDLPRDAELTTATLEARDWLVARRSASEIAERIEATVDGQSLSLLWNELCSRWISEGVAPHGAFKDAHATVANPDEYSYAQYLRSSPLDLEYLSDELTQSRRTTRG